MLHFIIYGEQRCGFGGNGYKIFVTGTFDQSPGYLSPFDWLHCIYIGDSLYKWSNICTLNGVHSIPL